jgi:hypothetical protein
VDVGGSLCILGALTLVDNMGLIIFLMTSMHRRRIPRSSSPDFLLDLPDFLRTGPVPLHELTVPLLDEAHPLPHLIVLEAHTVQLLLGNALALQSLLHVHTVLLNALLQLQRGRFVPTVLLVYIVQLTDVFLGLLFEFEDELLDLALIFFKLSLHLLSLSSSFFRIRFVLFALLPPLLQLGLKRFPVTSVLVQQSVPFLFKLLDLLAMSLRLFLQVFVSLSHFGILFFKPLGLLYADLECLPLLSE